MYQLRRPKSGEDDLEEMMRQFEEQKVDPSASAVNKRQSEETGVGFKKQKSLFSQSRANKTSEGNVEKNSIL